MSDITPPTTPPLATGGMSPSGTTTVVKINRAQVEGVDKQILCKAMCECDKSPTISVDGKKLKQNCVAAKMSAYAAGIEALPGYQKSEYKQEINYNMTTRPPTPIMDSSDSTQAHPWLRGYIKKNMPGFEKGTGQIRRPDIVIVKDPSKPPTQDNIKQIVEMKFPPDELSRAQREAYEDIAGDENKLVTLKPSDCDCEAPDDPKKKRAKKIVEAIQAAKIDQALEFISAIWTGGRGGLRMPPSPRPIPVPR